MIENKVSIIGGGTMGNGIAHVFAQYGFEVNLIDVNIDVLNRARTTIEKNLGRQVKKELISEQEAQTTLKRISTHLELKTAADSVLVIEAVPENLDLKNKVFRELDTVCDPQTILATNTSSISITSLGAETKRPDKVIGMHFMNPVPVMKLVEIIRGLATSLETYQTVENLAKKLEKVPVAVNDYPGFISNRILMPMINEAVYCLMEGVADKEAIDNVMKLGMNHPMGPLTLADFIGLDVCLNILEVLYEGLGDPKYRPCPLLKKMVAARHLGRKTQLGFYQYE